jgi:hypothetical protein
VSQAIELTHPTNEVNLHGEERRKEPRFPTLQRCIISLSGGHGPGGWHCIVYNISANGVGVTMPIPLPAGQILLIEPFELPGTRPILARIVHVKPVEFLWFCGCELFETLTDEEVRAWLTVKLGWLRKDEEKSSAIPW